MQRKAFGYYTQDNKESQNIKAKPEVYFSIDDENLPYKGVKGKSTVHNREIT